MTEEAVNVRLERLLADALQPIEPPEDLASRVETTLSGIAEQAAAELASWADELSEGELEALRDPRNWVRPVAAAAVGSSAAVGLVLVRTQRRRHKRRREAHGAADLLGRTLRDLAREARRVGDDLF
jgi:hypothetical protein